MLECTWHVSALESSRYYLTSRNCLIHQRIVNVILVCSFPLDFIRDSNYQESFADVCLLSACRPLIIGHVGE